MSSSLRFGVLALGAMVLAASCTEKESSIGMGLQDPLSLYQGTRCSIPLTACTLLDDSLATSGYGAGVVGTEQDSTFGRLNATIYSQITLSGSTGISFSDDVTVDSAVMTLVIDTFLAPAGSDEPLHFVAKQLAEPIDMEKSYQSTDTLAESNTVLFDSTVTRSTDSVRLRLRPAAHTMLKQTCSNEEFLQRVKGFSLRLVSPQNTLMAINYEATYTRLTLYYHTPETDSLQYQFVINSAAAHFMNYRHDYSGTPLEPIGRKPAEQVSGAQHLYLQPMGGTKVRIDMQPFIDTFCARHPNAVVHYAELTLPVSDPTAAQRPERILAYAGTASNGIYLVTDANVLLNAYTYTGFDGKYHADKHHYRLRLTRHLQGLLRQKRDYGLYLYIDARRSTPFSAVLNGYQHTEPMQLRFVYSE